MRAVNKTTVILLACFMSTSLLPGCTNWQKRYNSLLVEYRNMSGQLEYEKAEKARLAERIAQDQQLIQDLQRQAEANQPVADVSGFGPGYDVSYNPAAGTVTVTLPNAILFDSGKAMLKKATSAELDHIYSVLRERYSGKQIDVVGHTDTDPIKKSPWKDNWELSAERALTVARYLIDRGVPEDRIRAVGCGPARPVASNTTAAGKAKNRRVEITVYMRPSG